MSFRAARRWWCARRACRSRRSSRAFTWRRCSCCSVRRGAWDAADQALAKAVQRELKQNERGLESEVGKLGEPIREEDKRGGGSDDIGDVSWAVPTITLRYPANIPGATGHHWSSGIAMATPIAHKGCTAGAKVHALTMLDLLLKPALVQQAWEYYTNVQTKDQKYTPLLRPLDTPATFLNSKIMAEYLPRAVGRALSAAGEAGREIAAGQGRRRYTAKVAFR
jgi:metal-dependent amidase/aminoacylase/carboxypeptidase family protein